MPIDAKDIDRIQQQRRESEIRKGIEYISNILDKWYLPKGRYHFHCSSGESNPNYYIHLRDEDVVKGLVEAYREAGWNLTIKYGKQFFGLCHTVDVYLSKITSEIHDEL
jgi:hypothetical protein